LDTGDDEVDVHHELADIERVLLGGVSHFLMP
jgi:hypothetical protein